MCVYVERKRIFTRLWLYVSSQKSFKKITHVPFSLCTFFVASLLLRHVGVSLAVRPFVRPSIYLSGPFCSKGFCLCIYMYMYNCYNLDVYLLAWQKDASLGMVRSKRT